MTILFYSLFFFMITNGDFQTYDKKIKVAIIDNGVDFDHPVLKPFMGKKDNRRKNEHGTHVAGIIVQNIRKAIFNAHNAVEINDYPIISFHETNFELDYLVDALQRAIKDGNEIINLSIRSYTYDARIVSLIALNPQVLFITAAGNEGTTERTYPCAIDYPNVICVANKNGNYLFSTTNFNEYVKFVADGVLIKSTTLNGKYAYLTGTSMATPLVTAKAIVEKIRGKEVADLTFKNRVMISLAHKSFKRGSLASQ